MTYQEKAKILLVHGSYREHILKLLLDKDIEPKLFVIEDMLIEDFKNTVDADEVLEVPGDFDDLSDNERDDYTFNTWEEAWDFYKDSCVENIASHIRKIIGVDINDFELSSEVHKIVEQEAETVVF